MKDIFFLGKLKESYQYNWQQQNITITLLPRREGVVIYHMMEALMKEEIAHNQKIEGIFIFKSN